MIESTSRVPGTRPGPSVVGGGPMPGLLVAAGMATIPSTSWQAGEASPIRQLPLPQVHASSGSRPRFSSTTMDDRGRLADRTMVRSLGWGPRTAVTVTVLPDAGIVIVEAGGATMLTSGGFLRLSANNRHACRLRPGDRLLLVACPAERFLLAYTPYAVDAMTSTYRAAHADPGFR